MSEEQKPLSIKGTIIFIDPIKAPSEAKPDFKVRSFGLESTSFNNGQVYTNYFGFQTSQDSLNNQLDNFKNGDEVEVYYAIRGTKKDYPDKQGTVQNEKSTSIFTTLTAWRIIGQPKAQQTPPIQQAQQPQMMNAATPDDLPF